MPSVPHVLNASLITSEQAGPKVRFPKPFSLIMMTEQLRSVFLTLVMLAVVLITRNHLAKQSFVSYQ